MSKGSEPSWVRKWRRETRILIAVICTPIAAGVVVNAGPALGIPGSGWIAMAILLSPLIGALLNLCWQTRIATSIAQLATNLAVACMFGIPILAAIVGFYVALGIAFWTVLAVAMARIMGGIKPPDQSS